MVARSDFIRELPQSVIRQLYLGNLLDESGEVLPAFRTVRAEHSIIVRGSTNVTCRLCPECGRPVYYAGGKRYLCPEPGHDQQVLASDLSGLVLPQALFRSIDWRYPKRLVLVERLSVVDPPADGMPRVLIP
jgi:hypothetical protein